MDHTDREGGLRVARSLARNGECRNWRAVEARMQGLGYLHAELWFCSLTVRDDIEALCLKHFKGSPDA